MSLCLGVQVLLLTLLVEDLLAAPQGWENSAAYYGLPESSSTSMTSEPLSKPLRVAMLGMIPGNGHPYSWSAIVNGYAPNHFEACPFEVIKRYLGTRDPDTMGLPSARVTHVWTDNPDEARSVAAFANIPCIVERPEHVLGEVDAIIIATDDGDDHVRRVEHLLEAGVPIFVDKPLATNVPDLMKFCGWRKEGHRIISSSGLRFASEIAPLAGQSWKWLTSTTIKTWERYGIHALEPIFKILGPGFRSVSAMRSDSCTLFSLSHSSGCLVTIAIMPNALSSAGVIHGYSDAGHSSVIMQDTYGAFRAQLESFLRFAAGTAEEAFPFGETVELMAILIAGRLSIEQREEIPIASVLTKVGGMP